MPIEMLDPDTGESIKLDDNNEFLTEESAIKTRDEIQKVKIEKGLKIGIGQAGGFITIQFNGPVERIMMSKVNAKEFARRLIQESLK